MRRVDRAARVAPIMGSREGRLSPKRCNKTHPAGERIFVDYAGQGESSSLTAAVVSSSRHKPAAGHERPARTAAAGPQAAGQGVGPELAKHRSRR